MKKPLKTPSLLLLLGLLFVSMPQLIQVKTVEASNAFEIYKPNYQETWNEWNEADQVFNAVIQWAQYFGNYQYRAYWYDSSATRSLMLSQASSLGYWYDYVALMFKGHDPPCGCGYHHNLLDASSIGVHDGLDIYPNTASNKHDFVFLWACGTARWYPTSWCSTCGCYKGMPIAWTHNFGMDTDGYTETGDSGNEVFLGWSWGSPDFVYTDECKPGKNYADFVYEFYNYLLVSNLSVKQALNAAAADIFTSCTNFNDSPPREGVYVYDDYSYLRVFGNGDKGLP